VSAAVDALLARLADAEARLAEHAAAEDRGLPSGLTEPDPGGTERWEAGHVWAHLAEFPAYWLGEVRRVIAEAEAGDHAAPRFGRVKTDAGRLAAIERDRHTDPAALLERVRGSLADVVDAARGLPDAHWRLTGAHPTRGEMSVERIVEHFIVEHLEEHADQLDALRRG
jgi:hypothetical protein